MIGVAIVAVIILLPLAFAPREEESPAVEWFACPVCGKLSPHRH